MSRGTPFRMRNASLYAKANELQRNDALATIGQFWHLVQWLPAGGEEVLDIGCGCGSVTVDILQPRLPPGFGRLLGVDMSAEMVHHATEAYASADERLSFERLDLVEAQMPHRHLGAFHNIFSFFCFHWVQDQRQGFQNIYDMLQPNGTLFLTMLAYNPLYTAHHAMAKSPEWQPYMYDAEKFRSPYLHSIEPEVEVRQLLEDIGYEVVNCSAEERFYTYNSKKLLKTAVFAVSPFLSRIPADKHDEYFDAFIAEITKMNLAETNDNYNDDNNNDSDGKFFVPYRTLVIIGRKPKKV